MPPRDPTHPRRPHSTAYLSTCPFVTGSRSTPPVPSHPFFFPSEDPAIHESTMATTTANPPRNQQSSLKRYKVCLVQGPSPSVNVRVPRRQHQVRVVQPRVEEGSGSRVSVGGEGHQDMEVRKCARQGRSFVRTRLKDPDEGASVSGALRTKEGVSGRRGSRGDDRDSVTETSTRPTEYQKGGVMYGTPD